MSKQEWARRALKQLAFGAVVGAGLGAMAGLLTYGALDWQLIVRGAVLLSVAALLIVTALSVTTRFGRDI